MGLSHSPSLVLPGLTLCLDAANSKSILSTVEVLVVAGGGGGASGHAGGGGGAGGLIYSSSHPITPGSAITVTVGDGGAENANGGSSSAFNLTALGGGTGGLEGTRSGVAGGSGGGGAGDATPANRIGGAGTSSQGRMGGNGNGDSINVPGNPYGHGGGGGGAGQNGFDAGAAAGGNGGAGLQFSISGTPTYYGGGGGGGGWSATIVAVNGLGGLGGGGGGGGISSGVAGTPNTGGGGGGTNASATRIGGAGGSGIVIVRYPGSQRASGGTVTFVAGHTIHTFTTSGTFTPNGAPGTGTIWTDFSNNGNSGTLTNGPTYSSANGGSFVFDGTNDVIATSYGPQLNDFTVIAWFKSTGPNLSYDRIVDKDYANGIWIGRNGSSANSWGGGVLEASNPYGRYITLQDGNWHMIAFMRQGTTHTIYGDGITNSVSGTVSSSALSTTTFAFGNWSGVNQQQFSGNIAQVSIYNRALSAAEVSQNYNALRGRYGL